jgi:hypothetical protein
VPVESGIYVGGRYPPAACCRLRGRFSERPLLVAGVLIRTWVYIDGFNLYYGAVKGTAYRWLNPVTLAARLLPRACSIERVKYFTARVSGAADPLAPGRQQVYLSALATLSEVEIIYGRFLSKNIWRPITNFPVAAATIACSPAVSLPAGNHSVSGGSLVSPSALPVGNYPAKGSGRPRGAVAPSSNALITEVHSMEEKGSDVNLAAHLLNDAWKDSFDVCAVVSNDTDLVTPIRMVAVERQKTVYVVCPGRWQMSPHLAKVATFARHIRGSMLGSSQFPDPIPGTTIRKPPSW